MDYRLRRQHPDLLILTNGHLVAFAEQEAEVGADEYAASCVVAEVIECQFGNARPDPCAE